MHTDKNFRVEQRVGHGHKEDNPVFQGIPLGVNEWRRLKSDLPSIETKPRTKWIVN